MIKICIVEDEAIIADDIRILLAELGYECLKPCRNYDEAMAALQHEQPDMAILDINLKGKKSGIDVGSYIREQMNIPFIYLTANSDPDTVARAKETKPNAYLVKPFHKADLYASIEIALYNFNDRKPTPEKETKVVKNALFIKEGDYFHKVRFEDVLYLSSDHIYITVHTKQKAYMIRSSLQDYIENFDPRKFVRIHRSYVANVDNIEKINSANIIVAGKEIPISKNYREELLKMLHIG